MTTILALIITRPMRERGEGRDDHWPVVKGFGAGAPLAVVPGK